jgi:hypothetical protein
VKPNISWFVDAMNVSEAGGYGEVWGDWGQGFVDIEDILRLGVKRVVVDVLIVNTILLAASNTDLLKCIVSQA